MATRWLSAYSRVACSSSLAGPQGSTASSAACASAASSAAPRARRAHATTMRRTATDSPAPQAGSSESAGSEDAARGQETRARISPSNARSAARNRPMICAKSSVSKSAEATASSKHGIAIHSGSSGSSARSASSRTPRNSASGTPACSKSPKSGLIALTLGGACLPPAPRPSPQEAVENAARRSCRRRLCRPGRCGRPARPSRTGSGSSRSAQLGGAGRAGGRRSLFRYRRSRSRDSNPNPETISGFASPRSPTSGNPCFATCAPGHVTSNLLQGWSQGCLQGWSLQGWSKLEFRYLRSRSRDQGVRARLGATAACPAGPRARSGWPPSPRRRRAARRACSRRPRRRRWRAWGGSWPGRAARSRPAR